jgi:hypothetical protein
MESDIDQANDSEARLAPEAAGASKKSAHAPVPPIRSQPIVRRGIVALTVGLGACIGYSFGHRSGFAWIGGLLGYLVGRTIAPSEAKGEWRPSLGNPSIAPGAILLGRL